MGSRVVLRAMWRPSELPGSDTAEDAALSNQRVKTLLRAHYKEVWRILRHLGLPMSVAEDAAQQVFLVATAKLSRIEPGKERPFLIGTAVRIASNHRRSAAVRYECPDESPERHVDAAPGLDELLDQKRLRLLLDEVLAALPVDLRTVFVLFELEGLEVPEIAEIVGVPRGTASSRLRRAREAFERAARRVRGRYFSSEET
ncbi:MAG TPA: sigma-70 family RNA polymerase sigma factor [Polyangiaceae bacterium]|jgi:RNA polymerase sigma-70 factor (ECF subfamily)|nr:sigma-70 family RNA polymerase sigma factor [Polyangiaceae bacterium]